MQTFQTRLVLDWWVVFRFRKHVRLGDPMFRCRARLRRLIAAGYQVQVRRPLAPALTKLPSKFLLQHFRVSHLPFVPVVREVKVDQKITAHISTSVFYGALGGSWRRMMRHIRKELREQLG